MFSTKIYLFDNLPQLQISVDYLRHINPHAFEFEHLKWLMVKSTNSFLTFSCLVILIKEMVTFGLSAESIYVGHFKLLSQSLRQCVNVECVSVQVYDGRGYYGQYLSVL